MERELSCALVTGASSGIGKAISYYLLDKGYEVYGIGRNFEKCEIANTLFHPVVCDVTNTNDLKQVLNKIPRDRFEVVVNNAGCAWYGLHEELQWSNISDMVCVNLEVPMLISNAMIRSLRKNHGYLIQIASVTALSSSPHGAAYGATKAGLLSFSNSIWEENRKHQVKVCTILPDMTATDLYRNANFEASYEDGCYLLPQDVADAVGMILEQRENVIMNQIVLKPQFHRISRKKQEN